MALALLHSRALLGLDAPPVRVEVHLSAGLPAFGIVGLAETEVREARERVRSALLNSGLPYPSARRIVVNLAPADLPKESARYDLPIALGLLAASGLIPAAALDAHAFAGELSLSGQLRPVRGALAMVAAAAGQRFVLPRSSAVEAARLPEARVLGADHLSEVVAYLRGELQASDLAPGAAAAPAALAEPDLADVRGQAAARRALEIAAAGAHHLLLCGPPGSGKSMLAQRIVGLLPALDADAARQAAAIASLIGPVDAAGWGRPPWRNPHHSASTAAMVGGGRAGRLLPGEVSLAHGGVLFLDELPEFSRSVLEALREPLENHSIVVSRAGQRACFPADFQLLAALNPCPCGWSGDPRCRCTPAQLRRYRQRLSGPLLDRIDLQVAVPALRPDELLESSPGEPSATVAARVALARRLQLVRQGCSNARLAGGALERVCALTAADRGWLGQALLRLGASARSVQRLLRVARTLADLAGRDALQRADLAEALQYRAWSSAADAAV